MLEISDDVREQLARLEDLSDKAEAGDRKARQELRKALGESSPEIVARASDFARRGQWILAKTAAAGEPLMEEALIARLDHMRIEVAGSSPSPLEVLLVERICATWLLVELLEGLMNAQLKRGRDVQRVSLSYLKFVVGWLESAHRRYLSAIRELARVRKLQSATPGIQYNTQINVQSANIGATAKKATEEEPHH